MGLNNRVLRLLIVEDCAPDAELVLHSLRRGGYDTHWRRVETPEALRAALREETWDVVVCDYTLPGFNALGALEILHQEDCDLPFIVVSGTIGEDVAVETMRAGAHDYIMKGNLARLVPAIRRELEDAKVRYERHRAEHALRESEGQLSTIFDHAPVVMMLVDRDLTLHRINRAGIALTHRPPGALLGKCIGSALGCLHSLEHPQGCGFSPACKTCGVAQAIGASFDDETPTRTTEARLPLTREQRRSVLHFLVSATTLTLADTDMALVCLEDITDRKRAADALAQYASALEQTNRNLDASRKELGQFIYTSSHDLRAPIVSIHGFASLLKEQLGSNPDAQVARYVQRILANASTIEALLRDLLRVSRLDPQALGSQDLDFGSLAQEVLRSASDSDGQTAIQFICHLPVPAVRGDRPSLREALEHLVDNAVKYMPDREGPRIEFGYDPAVARPDGSHGAFFVRDNGAGIPAPYHGRIFQLFHRGPLAVSTAAGTGVGLTIVKRIVNALGGAIWLESAPGEGCCFYFHLPLSEEMGIVDPSGLAETAAVSVKER